MVLEALDSVRELNNDYISLNGELKGAFCKTARKAYDYVVKLCLIKIQEITNNAFEITCDDGYSYYKEGLKTKNESSKGKDFIRLEDTRDKYDWNIYLINAEKRGGYHS